MRQMLVATKETQGKRKNDFSHTTRDEPVFFSFECDSETVDGSCGCRRSMSGLESLKATTTFKVAERNGTNLTQRLMDHFTKDWHMSEEEARREAVQMDNELTRIAGAFPLGTILEKRGSKIQVRVLGKE